MNDDRTSGDGDDDAKVLDYHAPASQPLKWVSVWKPRNNMEANLAVATLQEHGIHARVDMENAADLGLAYAGVTYSKVQVLAADAEAARKLMLEIDQQRARRQEAMSVKCPRCGTANPKRIMHPLSWAAWGMLVTFIVLVVLAERIDHMIIGWLALLLLLGGFAALFWGVTPHWRCRKCGEQWYAKEPEELEDDDGEEDADGEDDQDPEPHDDDEAAASRERA